MNEDAGRDAKSVAPAEKAHIQENEIAKLKRNLSFKRIKRALLNLSSNKATGPKGEFLDPVRMGLRRLVRRLSVGDWRGL